MVTQPSGVQRFRTESYAYSLPPELIAQRPADKREHSRLLVLDGDRVRHKRFADIVDLVRPGDVFVANNTRVLRARFLPKRRGGGKAQVLLLHPVSEDALATRPQEAGTASRNSPLWEALVWPGQRVRVGDRLRLSDDVGFDVVGRTPLGTRIVRFYGAEPDAAMQAFGHVPLPPYIKHPPPDAAERYQTVYATHAGSVAAPTAGLHFTPELIAAIQARGAQWVTLTLDVSAGTFRPVKTADVRDHPMHAERYDIPQAAARTINQCKAAGGRVIAVGTTSVRSLEDSAQHSAGGLVEPGSRWTDLFIYPGFQFRVVDALLTNFHLPRSTLLMLVCAFAGTRRTLDAYSHAVSERYRFYSFGDAMFIASRGSQAPS